MNRINNKRARHFKNKVCYAAVKVRNTSNF